VSRSPVTLRDAQICDAAALVDVWRDTLRRVDPAEQEADLAAVINGLDPATERMVVAEYDGRIAGAVLLRAVTATPLNLEPVVQAVSPHVLSEFRRRGVGRALMDATATFAEERGIARVASGALSVSRDANRFLARLGLGPQVVLRAGPTSTLRSRLDARKPAAGRARNISQVLATRRTQRRRDASPVGKG
jgi:ribosomal protein S18 acetylase RimI-like enzyme